MTNPSPESHRLIHQLHRIREGFQMIQRDFARAFINQDFDAMATIDTSAFTPLLAELETVTLGLTATISGDVTAAVDNAVAATKAQAATDQAAAVSAATAEQLASDQAANDSIVAQFQDKLTALQTATTPKQPEPVAEAPAAEPIADPNAPA